MNAASFCLTAKKKPGAPSSGPLAGPEIGKRAENREKVSSQWSTLKSGPLARPEIGKRVENREKVSSQWSTLESGPLARTETGKKGGKPGKSQEPVVHFKEWTTSSVGNQEKGRKTGEKPGASGPL